MEPELIALFAAMIIAVPVACILAFGVPVYLGILASLYLVYKPEGNAPSSVLDMKFDVSRVIESYVKLVHYWHTYDQDLSLEKFVIPLFAPAGVGVLTGIFLLRLVIMYCINRFRVT